MRRKIVAGNWKMNTSLNKGTLLANEVKLATNDLNNNKTEIILGLPYTHIASIHQILGNGKIKLSAQNCSEKESGAFTGEISAEMISSCGASYCIIGHSERRHIYHEDDKTLAEKVRMAFKHNLTPIFCCGEQQKDREDKKYFDIIEKQLVTGLFHLDIEDIREVIIAYEPVWAIGTGLTASPEQAQEIHQFIRQILASRYNKILAQEIPILYGGSCKPSNAKQLFSQQDIDGGLIGGAALNANDFIAIVNSF